MEKEVDPGGEYRLVLASDVIRDGMGLELQRPDGSRVAEVFQSDVDGKRTFTTFDDAGIDLATLDWFVARARARL